MKDTINALIYFDRIDLQNDFKVLDLPIELNQFSINNISKHKINIFIGDVVGFEKCIDHLNEINEIPDKVIILKENFNPHSHLKKETVLINNIRELINKSFWDAILTDGEISYDDLPVEKFSHGINNIFEVGGVIDDINYFLSKKEVLSLEVCDSIFKVAQFISSLFRNDSILGLVVLDFYSIGEGNLIKINFGFDHNDLDPLFLLDYLFIDSNKYEQNMLLRGLEQANLSKVSFDDEKFLVELIFDKKADFHTQIFKINKVITPLSGFADEQKISAESSGVLLGFTKVIDDDQISHAGIDHRPSFNPQQRKNVEDLVVKVIGAKENYSDEFDLEKIKKVINDDMNISAHDYTDEELQRVCDISNDVESTVILARAKEDLFNQTVESNDLEDEIVSAINGITDNDMPYVIAGKAGVDLDEEDRVVVTEPERVMVEDSVVVVGEDRIDKEEIVDKISNFTKKIKEEIIKVKGTLKSKEDVDNFVIKLAEKESPDLVKHGQKISRNLMAGFLSRRMEKVVHSNKKWDKMNEVIKSYRKKVVQKEKEIKKLESTIGTLRLRGNQMHPVFKEVIEQSGSNKSDSDLNRALKRKDNYIKKLEAKLLDKQYGDIRVIKSDDSGLVNSDIVIKKGKEEKSFFRNDKEVNRTPNPTKVPNKSSTNELSLNSSNAQIEKFKNIGRQLATKLKDSEAFVNDLKVRQAELERNSKKNKKDKHKISLEVRRSNSKIVELESKLSKLKKQLKNNENKVGDDKVRVSLESNYNRKIEKLESVNNKLSDGTKSLAKKLTSLQGEYNSLKTEKRTLELRLRHSDQELMKYKETLKRQLQKVKKVS